MSGKDELLKLIIQLDEALDINIPIAKEFHARAILRPKEISEKEWAMLKQIDVYLNRWKQMRDIAQDILLKTYQTIVLAKWKEEEST